jgi:hypothetical protein
VPASLQSYLEFDRDHLLRHDAVDQFLQFTQPLPVLLKTDRVALSHVRHFRNLEILHKFLQREII